MQLEELNEMMKASHVLIAFKSANGTYLEMHEVQDGKKVVMGAGQPLTKKALRSLLAEVTQHDKSMLATVKNMLPENVLYFDQRLGKHTLVWFNPPQKKILKFETTSIKSGASFMPGMVFAVKDGYISVFAYKGRKRPVFATKLFHIPLFNVYEDGHVCMGNVKTPAGIVDIKDAIEAWERAFWCSDFTHTVWSEAYKDLKKFWKGRMKLKRPSPFPEKMLVQCKEWPTNLKSLCQK